MVIYLWKEYSFVVATFRGLQLDCKQSIFREQIGTPFPFWWPQVHCQEKSEHTVFHVLNSDCCCSVQSLVVLPD